MDRDHLAIAELLNRLHRMHTDSAPPDEAAALLDDIGAHATAHFAREEAVMERAGYPAAAAHVAEHRNLLDDFGNVMAEYRQGQYRGSEDALENYLKYWLIDHIARIDKKLAAFLAAKNSPA